MTKRVHKTLAYTVPRLLQKQLHKYVTQQHVSYLRRHKGFFFFLECFIPSSPEYVHEAHPTPLPKFTARAETQEAFGAAWICRLPLPSTSPL